MKVRKGGQVPASLVVDEIKHLKDLARKEIEWQPCQKMC